MSFNLRSIKDFYQAQMIQKQKLLSSQSQGGGSGREWSWLALNIILTTDVCHGFIGKQAFKATG